MASAVARRPMTGPPLGAAPNAEPEVTNATPKRIPASASAANPNTAARRARRAADLVGELAGQRARLAELGLGVTGEMVGVLVQDAGAQAAADPDRAQLLTELGLKLRAHTNTASTAREKSRHSLRRVPSSRWPRRVSS